MISGKTYWFCDADNHMQNMFVLSCYVQIALLPTFSVKLPKIIKWPAKWQYILNLVEKERERKVFWNEIIIINPGTSFGLKVIAHLTSQGDTIEVNAHVEYVCVYQHVVKWMHMWTSTNAQYPHCIQYVLITYIRLASHFLNHFEHHRTSYIERSKPVIFKTYVYHVATTFIKSLMNGRYIISSLRSIQTADECKRQRI